MASEFKYVPVARTFLFIERSLEEGLKWTVLEPNDESLWAKVRLEAGTFLHGLFAKGAFQGGSPRDAYFIRCGAETTSAHDIGLGRCIVEWGIAPIRAGEFIVARMMLMTGGPE